MSDAVAMSFKARMNKLSKECGLRPQSVIQNYMFERFLQRLAESPYRENFVIKGGAIGMIEYSYPCHFAENMFLSLKAYSLETVLAEKCEAILRRNVVGTRPRDYYDVYLLTRTYRIDMEAFAGALKATCELCGTSSVLDNIEITLSAVRDSAIQAEYWARFQREFPYAKGIFFVDAVNAVCELLGGLR